MVSSGLSEMKRLRISEVSSENSLKAEGCNHFTNSCVCDNVKAVITKNSECVAT